MKTTAEKFNRAPAEAFRCAYEGATVTIAHGQYPGVRFELTARPAKSTGTIDQYDVAAIRSFDDIDKKQVLAWITSNCGSAPTPGDRTVDLAIGHEPSQARSTEITKITEKALSSIESNMDMAGLSTGIYAQYAAKVSAEVFRHVMHVTINDMDRAKVFSIASQIEGGDYE